VLDAIAEAAPWRPLGSAGFPAGSSPARLDAASAASGLVREHARGRRSSGASRVIP
jgi:hypothetical protein